MSMKFVPFDSGTVLIIAIAIIYSYFEQPWSPVHCLYTLHICFPFIQVHLEAFGPNHKFVHPFKLLIMSTKFVHFDSGTVLIIAIAI